MRKLLTRLSPAMAVAMLALFVALSGTAVATTSALITGKQIKNSSITGADVKNRSLRPIDFRGSIRGPRGLRGLTGATGATGAPGAKGDKGDKGDTGSPGPLVSDLPAGVTLRGTVHVAKDTTAGGDVVALSVPFGFQLAAAPVQHLIAVGALPPAGCSGTAAAPGADPGHLCLFLTYKSANSSPTFTANQFSNHRLGFGMFSNSTGAGRNEWTGNWAVTGSAAAVAAVPNSAATGAPSAQP